MFVRCVASVAVVLLGAAWTPHVVEAQAAAERLTLAGAMARARTLVPDAAARRARADAVRRGAADAARLPNPIFEFRQENWLSGVPRSTLPLDTFAEVTQLVELGGKRDARRQVALAQAGVASAEAVLVERSILREVAEGFLDAVRHRDRRDALRAQATDLGELVRILERRVVVGTTAEADLLRLRAEEARTGLEVVRSEVVARQALTRLEARLDLDVTLDGLERPPAADVGQADVASAVARDPAVLLALRGLEQARQELRLENARAIPDPSVNAGWKRTVGVNTAQMTFSVPVPIFTQNNQARAVAAGTVRAAELEVVAAERRARGELRAARDVAGQLIERAATVRATLLEPARAARDAARAAFQAGALDVMRLVDAERTATEAALVTTEVELDAVLATVHARFAAGEEPVP